MLAQIFLDEMDQQRALLGEMEVVGDQAGQLAVFGRRWVTRPEGFETSPVCVLSPLGRAMRLLADGCESLQRDFDAGWEELRADVAGAFDLLQRTDRSVAEEQRRLGRRVERERS